VKPVTIELSDFKTKKHVDTLEVDACLVATGRAPYTQGLNITAIGAEADRRGFIPVSDTMQVRGDVYSSFDSTWTYICEFLILRD
jgi:dihydrolipoamide dehydrogenase